MAYNGPVPVLNWTIPDVRAWLTELGMARYAKIFCDQHKIDGPALLMLQVVKINATYPTFQFTVGTRPETATLTTGSVGRC